MSDFVRFSTKRTCCDKHKLAELAGSGRGSVWYLLGRDRRCIVGIEQALSVSMTQTTPKHQLVHLKMCQQPQLNQTTVCAGTHVCPFWPGEAQSAYLAGSNCFVGFRATKGTSLLSCFRNTSFPARFQLTLAPMFLEKPPRSLYETVNLGDR